MSFTRFIQLIVLAVSGFFLAGCDPAAEKKGAPASENPSPYLGHSDSAKYVGMNTCRQCHQDIYNTFIKTGMGSSFDKASRQKSAASFTASTVYDKLLDLHYRAYWTHDSLFMNEYRLAGSDTVYSRIEQVNYIIGSGQHTNSHLQTVGGYIHQMPMTFYTQKKKWDLPPGFENGSNTRFSRKIGLECMSCHNAYPDFVQGSENKFRSVPLGIDCERCHGPGSFHVEQRQTNAPIDTSKFVDYSIVNPAKLSIERQFDICQRCHLQGNAILKEGRSFFDFKPGEVLSDYMTVFLPRYSDSDQQFVMASHADRLKQSPCFIESLKKTSGTNKLKPYKEALTCVTCHNPHVSVRETDTDVFNRTCANCHGDDIAAAKNNEVLKQAKCGLHPSGLKNCVSCHMPASGSTDIPHVSVHDHFIRKPVTAQEKNKIRTFLGLSAINEKQPDLYTRARAYIDQFEKFSQDTFLLDSANLILDKINGKEKVLAERVQLHFIRRQYERVIKTVNEVGEKKAGEILVKMSYDNRHAWASYRIGESYVNLNAPEKAKPWFENSVKLAPYNMDFRNKLGTVYATLADIPNAEKQFEYILSEYPRFVSAYVNLGYIKLRQGFPAEAIRLYTQARKLDPDSETLLLNLTGYYLYMKDYNEAKVLLKELIRKHPQNQQARQLMQQLSAG